jgi:hypothetical protein
MEGFGSDTISAALLPHAPSLQWISLQLEGEHFRKLDIVLFPIPETLSLACKSPGAAIYQTCRMRHPVDLPRRFSWNGSPFNRCYHRQETYSR